MFKFKGFAFVFVGISIILNGCGGSSSNYGDPTLEDDVETVLTGRFVDSAVEGASYETATQSGTTNTAGEFRYVDGETVIFSIGELTFPTVMAAEIISPFELSADSSNPDITATNIARLLQSLDEDGYPYNGIRIPVSASANAASIDFDVSAEAFENDPAVINLVANSGSSTLALISADRANLHLFQIDTNSEFTNVVVGRQLVFRDSNGLRDESSQAVVGENGKVQGFSESGELDLDWYWEEQFYCRSGTSASGQNIVSFDCQVVSSKDGILTFVRERGAGDVSTSWYIE